MTKFYEILSFRIIEFENFHLSIGNITFLFLVFISVRLSFGIIKRLLHKRLLLKGKVDDGRLVSILQLIQYFIIVIALVLVINSLVISLGEEVFSKPDYKSTMIYVSGVVIAVLIFFIIFGFLKGLFDMFSIIDSPAGSFILLGLLFATINLLKSNQVTD